MNQNTAFKPENFLHDMSSYTLMLLKDERGSCFIQTCLEPNQMNKMRYCNPQKHLQPSAPLHSAWHGSSEVPISAGVNTPRNTAGSASVWELYNSIPFGPEQHPVQRGHHQPTSWKCACLEHAKVQLSCHREEYLCCRGSKPPGAYQ
ncbi:hypothetical protein K439DRAFT_1617028 [Ramaria rubella]|nr:hypothetical protein K439DRAFT_1617028 [Ramaria rubella]